MPIALPYITISGPGLRFGGPGGFPSGREVKTFALGDTATYLRGNHIIKFGGEARRVKHYNFNQDPGSFTYPSVAAFQQGFGSQFGITLDTVASQAGAAALAPSFTDPDFAPGRMQTWNVNVEREIVGTGVMVGYFGSHGDRQRIPINFNQFVTPGGTARPYPKLSATSP